MSEGYYVYLHVDPETNQIQYVGKGSGARAWSLVGRSQEHIDWLTSMTNQGVSPDEFVIVVHSGLSEDRALQKEKQIIAKLNQEILFNLGHGAGTRNWLTPEQKTQIYDLWKEGNNYSDIADEVKCSYQVARNWCLKYSEEINDED